jgi:hypothetical protein
MSRLRACSIASASPPHDVREGIDVLDDFHAGGFDLVEPGLLRGTEELDETKIPVGMSFTAPGFGNLGHAFDGIEAHLAEGQRVIALVLDQTRFLNRFLALESWRSDACIVAIGMTAGRDEHAAEKRD